MKTSREGGPGQGEAPPSAGSGLWCPKGEGRGHSGPAWGEHGKSVPQSLSTGRPPRRLPHFTDAARAAERDSGAGRAGRGWERGAPEVTWAVPGPGQLGGPPPPESGATPDCERPALLQLGSPGSPPTAGETGPAGVDELASSHGRGLPGPRDPLPVCLGCGERQPARAG